MKGQVRRILYVWGYYRLSTLLLLMTVLLVFAGFVCSSANGVWLGVDPQPKCADGQMALLTKRLHLTSEQQTQIRPVIEFSHEN